MTKPPPALLLIDVQQGFDHPRWGPRNNPQAESQMARLIKAWREQGHPIIHVRQEDERFIIVANDCASIPHTISQIAVDMSRNGAPLDVIFGWSKGNPLKLALDFVLFGQGDIPNLVADLLDDTIKDEAKRPTVIVG